MVIDDQNKIPVLPTVHSVELSMMDEECSTMSGWDFIKNRENVLKFENIDYF
jgi:hypothetical protein